MATHLLTTSQVAEAAEKAGDTALAEQHLAVAEAFEDVDRALNTDQGGEDR